MANSTTSQIILDGPRNVTLKYEGILDTADLGYTIIADPSTMQGIDNTGSLKAAKLRIETIYFVVEDNLAVNLFWDATTPQRIESFVGRGHAKYQSFGGLVNNAGAGLNGKIGLTTQGASAGQVLSFSLTLNMVKTQ